MLDLCILSIDCCLMSIVYVAMPSVYSCLSFCVVLVNAYLSLSLCPGGYYDATEC